MAGRGSVDNRPAWMTRGLAGGGGGGPGGPGAGGADVYAYEANAERDAELRALHAPMRAFYEQPAHAPLRARFGGYPSLWQELVVRESPARAAVF